MVRLFAVTFLAWLACLSLHIGSASAQPMPVPTLRAVKSGSNAIKVSITLSARNGKPAMLRIERSSAGGAFQSIAEFENPRLRVSHTDRNLSAGRHTYRARILAPRTSKWSPRAAVVIGSSSGGGGSAPTPTPGASYFDSSGNVTSSGKSAFSIPSELSANRNTGQSLWNSTCALCHSSPHNGRDFFNIQRTVAASPMFLSISDQNVAHIVAYLNRFRTP